MDGRSEFLVYLGSALATITGLFAVQLWYESFLDVSVVHASQHDAAMYGKLAEVRAEEEQKLGSGRMPIDKAIGALAQRGRAGFPKLVSKPSDDLSAMSGWIHKPNFKPYEPRKPAVVAAPADGTAVEGSAEGAPAAVEGSTAPAAGEAAPAAGEAAPVGQPSAGQPAH